MEDCYKMLHNLTNNKKKTNDTNWRKKKVGGTQNKLNNCL